MDKKEYIYIAEESCVNDEICITPKWKNMKYIEKIINKILTPIQKTIENSIEDRLKSISESLEKLDKLNGEVEKLTNRISTIESRIKLNNEDIQTLRNNYNSKRARFETIYKEGIYKFCELNLRLAQSAPAHGRIGKLEIHQKLVSYTYAPTEDLRKEISEYAQTDKDIQSIFSAINNFNEEYKPRIVDYLSKEVGKRWEDCVLFPQEKVFNSQAMAPFNDDIEEGTPVYIIALGFDFPNSNREKQLPKVMARVIK